MKYFPEVLVVSALVNAILFPSWPNALVLLVLALLYMQKHDTEAKAAANPPLDLGPVNKEIEKVKADQKKTQDQYVEVMKIAEETKRVLTQANIGMAFRPRINKKD